MLTILAGVFFIGCSIFVYVWQYYNAYFSPAQWHSSAKKAIVITGCDSGIGHRIVQHLYNQGLIVIAACLDVKGEGAKELERVCQPVEGDERRLHLVQMDITKWEQVQEAAKQTEKILGHYDLEGLWALVNNAGRCLMGEFDWYSVEQCEGIVNTNLLGMMRVTKAFLPLVIKAKGRVVNVSSVNGSCAYPGLSVYCATKYAIEGFSDVLRFELSKFEVRVVVVKPGDFARLTNLMHDHERHEREQYNFGMNDAKRALYGDYFDVYHHHIKENYGMTSPKSFEKSTLLSDFEEAVLAVKPRTYIISAPLLFRIIFFFYRHLSVAAQDYLLQCVYSRIFKFDVTNFPPKPTLSASN